MKILLVNKYHYLRGGSERVYFNTKELLERNGHEVICFSMKDERNLPCPQEKYFVPEVDFSNHKSWPSKVARFFYNVDAARRLEQLILEEKPDIAHLHNIAHQLTPSILKPLRKHNIPIVQTLHDFHLICPAYSLLSHGKICERCKKHKYYQCILHICVQNSFPASVTAALDLTAQHWFKYYKENVDLFISPSNFLKNKLEEWGVEEPIEVVNYPIDLRPLQPKYEAGDYLIYFGRLSPDKGIRTLIRAMKSLPDIKLKVAGDGPLKSVLSDYIAENKMTNVELLGPKYGEELFDLIRNARFVVVPSECYDNYPLAVLESFALGKPVLGTRLGGIPELIVENYNGWFFEYGNVEDSVEKIKLHFNEKESIVEFGKHARQMIEKQNSPEKDYYNLMRCYDMVLESNKVKGG